MIASDSKFEILIAGIDFQYMTIAVKQQVEAPF